MALVGRSGAGKSTVAALVAGVLDGHTGRIIRDRRTVDGATVLVLDEATAEAGSSGTRDLDRAIDRMRTGRTTLLVAHRLDQATRADRVSSWSTVGSSRTVVPPTSSSWAGGTPSCGGPGRTSARRPGRERTPAARSAGRNRSSDGWPIIGIPPSPFPLHGRRHALLDNTFRDHPVDATQITPAAVWTRRADMA